MNNKKLRSTMLLALGGLNILFSQTLFDARINEDCSMDLIWSYENVEEYDHFTIQWSEDGKNFKSIGFIESTALDENNRYVFSDNFQSFHNYYRLKSITREGKISLSKMIHTKNDCGIDGYMEVYPNPIVSKGSRLNINFFTDKMRIPIVLYENNGEPLKFFNIDTPEEWNTLSMDISGLESGIYYIEVGEIGLSKITIMAAEETFSSK